MLYERSQEGSCFKTIVTAVSYANYSSRCNAPFAQALAEDFLGKGLKLLRKNIADKKHAATDDVLGSVYMMGVFENLVTPRRDGNFVAHKEGANALLQLRNIDEFYSNPISSRLYEILFAQMVSSCFCFTNKCLPQTDLGNSSLAACFLRNRPRSHFETSLLLDNISLLFSVHKASTSCSSSTMKQLCTPNGPT